MLGLWVRFRDTYDALRGPVRALGRRGLPARDGATLGTARPAPCAEREPAEWPFPSAWAARHTGPCRLVRGALGVDVSAQ